jgi:hypothetical protein
MTAQAVLPNFAQIDADISSHQTATAEEIRRLAEVYGGVRTKFYDQGNKIIGAMKYFSMMTDRQWGGVCWAMSIYWIAMHANDQDFWGWIDANKGGNLQTYWAILGAQQEYFNDLKLANDLIAARFLGQPKWGLVPKKDVASGAALAKLNCDLGSTVKPFRGRYIAQRLPGTSGGCYYLITITQPGGHTIAAWVSKHDAVFFDPNFGEFWFHDAAHFRAWFPSFYSKTPYTKYGRCFFEVYGKKAW